MSHPIKATEHWLKNTVIELGFCPFAVAPFKAKSIVIQETNSAKQKVVLQDFLQACQMLEQNPEKSTVLLVLSQGFESFSNYLLMLDRCQTLLEMEGYEGIFQLASFHPDYCFEGEDADAPSHYTNRSPWPIIHILREDDLLQVNEQEGERIYHKNIRTCEAKGVAYLQALLEKSKTL